MRFVHVTAGTVDMEGVPPATGYAAGRWWDLRTLDATALTACGWFPLVETGRPADTPTTTTDRTVANLAGAWTETWTVRAWTTEELSANSARDARAALRTELVAAIAWLRAHADTYRNAPPATTGNTVSYVETLRQDMPVFMAGLADLLAQLFTEGA